MLERPESRALAHLARLAQCLAGASIAAVWVEVPGRAPYAAIAGELPAGAPLRAFLEAGPPGRGFGRLSVPDVQRWPEGGGSPPALAAAAAGIRSFAVVAPEDGQGAVWVGATEPREWTPAVLAGLEEVTSLATLAAETDAQASYRQLVELSPDPIAVHADGIVIFVNAAALRLIGASTVEELVGRPISDFLDVPVPDSAARTAMMLQTGNPAPVVQATFRRFDGGLLRGQIAAAPTLFEGRRAIQVVIRDITEQAAAEEALRRREQEFKALVEDAPDPIIRFDATGRVSYVNPAAERYTGLTAAELMGAGERSAGLTPRTRGRWRRTLRRVFATGEPGRITFSLASRAGEYVFECRISPQHGPDGGVDSALAVGRDITELMQASRALRRSEATLRALIDGAAIGISQVTREGRYVDVNPAFAGMLGYTREEMRARTFPEITHPDDQELTLQMHLALVRGGVPRAQIEKRYLRKDGSILWGRLTASMVEIPGGVPHLVGMVEDITARKAAEEALKEREARFRSLIEHASDLIAILGPDGLVQFQSSSARWVLGLDPEELLGKNLFLRIHPDDVAAVQALFADVVAQPGRVASAEFRFRHADGRWLTLQSTAENRLSEPAVRGIVVNTRDLTVARELEAQLFQSRKLEAIGRLAGGVAHDFNNILTAVQGHASLLSEELPADSPHRGDVEQIQRSAERAASLTRQLLAFSRRQLLLPQVVDLNAIVVETDRMLRRLIGEDVEFEAELDPELGYIRADPAQIQQILLNLAVNARDAMPGGGRLRLRTAGVRLTDDLARPNVGPVVPGRYVLLEVADTGCGIEPSVVEHIFEPFFTTKPPGKGTGLGLSSVYGTVKQSGGYIAVDTEVGRGTAFRIYLPLVDEDEPTEAPAPEAQPPGSGVILLVEDEEAVRSLACRVLERTGYTVLQAGDGEEALEICASLDGAIDLVLTDVVMPSVGGPELAERIAALRPETRVLFMSGYTQDDLAARGVGAPTGFLGKPFSPDLLRRKVAEALSAGPRATSLG